MPNRPALTLIIITQNSGHRLQSFVDSWGQSVATTAALRAGGIEVIMADRGSHDDTITLAEKILPDATILDCGNISFGNAVNKAARQAQGDWLLLCNSNLTFAPQFASLLIEPMLAPSVEAGSAVLPWRGAACLAPRLIHPDGSPQPSVGYFPTCWRIVMDPFRRPERRRYVFPHPSRAMPMDWAKSACLLLRRDPFHTLGGFDENYFQDFEEVDLQRRLKNAGHVGWVVPYATVIHHHRNETQRFAPEIACHVNRGRLRYFAKFGSPVTLFLLRLMLILGRQLPLREALASRRSILKAKTGP